MLRPTTFELIPKLKQGDTLSFSLVRRNNETRRYEAFLQPGASSDQKIKAEMIQTVNLQTQQQNIENNVHILLNHMETEGDIFKQDPEYRKAYEEAVHLVHSLAEPYFDPNRAYSYFFQPVQRKKLEETDQGDWDKIDEPIIRKKSSKIKAQERQPYFYQEDNGSNTYVHYLCLEFIDHVFKEEDLPKSIKVIFIYIDYSRRFPASSSMQPPP